jgi:hypothetical protein
VGIRVLRPIGLPGGTAADPRLVCLADRVGDDGLLSGRRVPPDPGSPGDRLHRPARHARCRRRDTGCRRDRIEPGAGSLAALRLQHGHGRRLGLHHDHGDRDNAGALVRSAAGDGDQPGAERGQHRGLRHRAAAGAVRPRHGPGEGCPHSRTGCACGVAAGGAGWRRAPAGRWPARERADPQGRRPRRCGGFAVADQPVAGAGQSALLACFGAVRARPRGAGGLHRAPGGIPAAASRQSWRGHGHCEHCNRRHRRAVGTGRCDRPVEPAPRLGRQLRQSGCRAGTDARSARLAGRAVRRQHRVRIIGGQRHPCRR